LPMHRGDAGQTKQPPMNRNNGARWGLFRLEGVKK
jgi:hypothetical protein